MSERDGTECGATLNKEGKHATTCPCGHALSARHSALRDEIANIARRTGLCADIEVLVDHPAIDPENGARMDVGVSKPGVQNSDELIDVRVTPFCVEAAGLVGKAATIAESKKRTKCRPAVVTPAILETHGRMGPPPLKRSWPRSPRKTSKPGATWLQDATRRISCVLQVHNARTIAKCNGSI